MILNPNSNLGIQTMKFQIRHCLKRHKQGILKSMNFKSRHFKSIDFKSKSKCCHPNTTAIDPKFLTHIYQMCIHVSYI